MNKMETVELLHQTQWRGFVREVRRLQEESLLYFGPTRESAKLLERQRRYLELKESEITDYQI